MGVWSALVASSFTLQERIVARYMFAFRDSPFFTNSSSGLDMPRKTFSQNHLVFTNTYLSFLAFCTII
jgi:hypothetical protein